MRVTADLCDQQGIAFIPMAAESLGGWHKVALEQLRKMGSALARHTGQEEGETISHLLTRASVPERALLVSPQQDPRPPFTSHWRHTIMMIKTNNEWTRKMILRKELKSHQDLKEFSVSIHPSNTFANKHLSHISTNRPK